MKRVDRLARLAPDLLLKVAAGQLSAKKALNEALTRTDAKLRPRQGAALAFPVETAVLRLRRYIKAEWSRCPRECRAQFLDALRQQLHELMQERAATHVTTPAHGEHRAPFIGRAPRVSSAGNGL